MVCSPSVQHERKMNKIKPIPIPLTHKNRRVHLLSGLLSLTFFFSVTLFWSLLHIMYLPPTPPTHPRPHLSLRVSCQAAGKRWNCQKWWMTINLLLSPTPLLRDLHSRRLPGMKTNLSLYSSRSLTPFSLSAIYPSIFYAGFFPLLLS